MPQTVVGAFRGCLWRRIRLCLAVLLLFPVAVAFGLELRFERISLEQGLSQSTVFCLLQDRDGFLWLGGEYGLNRFDGYGFTHFCHDPTDPQSLPSNQARALAEDAHGRVLVGTLGGGLSSLDPERKGFRRFRHDPSDPASLSSDDVRALAVAPDGEIWIATGEGLDRLDPATGNIVRFRHDPSRPGSLSDDRVTTVHCDRWGRVWVGTVSGLNLLESSGDDFIQFPVDPTDPGALADGHVTCILETVHGTVWIGTRKGGLHRLDVGRRAFRRFRSDAGNPATVSDDAIGSLCEDHDGRIWVGTAGGGLNLLDPATGLFRRFPYETEPPAGTGSRGVAALLEDSSHVLWIGTDLAGLFKLDLKGTPFRIIRAAGETGRPRSGSVVFSVLEDSHGVLWLGTGGGLRRADLGGDVVERVDAVGGRPVPALSHSIYALHEGRDGTIWVGTWGGGLVALRAADGKVEVWHNDPRDPASLALDAVLAVLEDSTGRVWIGTWGGGLDRLDRASGRFVHHAAGMGPGALHSNYVRTLFEDSRGALWVGTMGGGLSRRDPVTGTFTTYRNDRQNPTSLSDDSVSSIHEDPDSTLWVGTSGGLNRFDRQRGTFTSLRVRDGLPSDAITGILADEEGRLWVAHFRGISCFDPRARTFSNFDASHGLQGIEFNSAVAGASKTGALLFGGINGLVVFNPRDVRRNPFAPRPLITSVKVYGDETPLPPRNGAMPALALEHNQNFLSFEFVGLELTAPARITYSHMLEGLDRGWIESGGRRYAAYANLAPGAYTFRVRACNDDGVWSEEAASLRVDIAPPFWQTWWFRVAGTATLLLALLGLHQWRTQTLRRRLDEQIRVERIIRDSRDQLQEAKAGLERYSVRLEEMVGERTGQLAAANEKLQALATRDSLTGLANRRRLEEFVDSEWRRAKRFVRPVAAILVDIDHFKSYNDTYGHQAGDDCLRRVTSVLAEIVGRPGDLLARYGGEEFLAVLSETSQAVAFGLAERMRRAVEELSLPHPHGEPLQRVTISAGVAATVPHGEGSWEGLVEAADRALYAAKAAGRNRVIAAPGM